MLTTLVACGGGDGGFNSDNETPDAITVELIQSGGDANGYLTSVSNITVTATVMEGANPVQNQLVTFVLTDNALASFFPTSGTMSTDVNGEASIDVIVSNVAGGVEVSASYNTISSTPIAFNSLGDGIFDDGSSDEPEVSSIALFASSQRLASSGSQEIELIAIAKDASNNLLEGVTLNFSATSGAVEVINSLTGPDGKASAKLTTGFEKNNRVISVTAGNSVDVNDVLDIQVVGTTITFTGSSSLAINDSNSYIIKVLDSDGNGIANTVITLSLSNESTEIPASEVAAIILSESAITDATGQAAITVTGTTGGTNSLIATALGTSANKVVAVQADSFLFTRFSNEIEVVIPSAVSAPAIPDVLLSKTANVSLTWLRSGVAVADGTEVNFTTTRGALVANSAMTIDGVVTATLTSTDAGKALITFVGSDTISDKTIELTNQIEFEFVADTAVTIKAQASPNSIAPDGQTSTISVVVKDVNGNLVKNKTIIFELSDTNNGEIFPASAVTNSNGSASTVYTSSNTSAQDGVEVTATVKGTTITDTVSLTVADRELFIALGTGNSILNIDETTYNKQYSVFVTDVDSTPQANVNLTVSAIPKQYYKGFWVVVLKEGEFDHYAPFYTATCDNEDVDFDGFLTAGEDYNGDEQLTPGNIANAIGEVTTDDQGRAIIDILYAEVFGNWVDIDLIVSTKVQGTEGFTQVTFNLPVSGEDISNEGTPPATFVGFDSPFGNAIDCSNAN